LVHTFKLLVDHMNIDLDEFVHRAMFWSANLFGQKSRSDFVQLEFVLFMLERRFDLDRKTAFTGWKDAFSTLKPKMNHFGFIPSGTFLKSQKPSTSLEFCAQLHNISTCMNSSFMRPMQTYITQKSKEFAQRVSNMHEVIRHALQLGVTGKTREEVEDLDRDAGSPNLPMLHLLGVPWRTILKERNLETLPKEGATGGALELVGMNRKPARKGESFDPNASILNFRCGMKFGNANQKNLPGACLLGLMLQKLTGTFAF